MGNPYTDQDFFGFLWILGKRLWSLFSDGFFPIVSDEVQLVILCCIALSCTFVGVFLVHAQKTMVANALSHTILLGIVIAFLVQRLFFASFALEEGMSTSMLLVAALVSALLTTLFTEYLTKKIHVQEDASIGLVFTLFFASGVILLTLFARNMHIGTELVMGNVDSLHKGDILPVFKILILTMALFLLFFKEFKISTFDPAFAQLQGLKPLLFQYLLLFQTAIVAMSAFQAVGVIMVLALFVAPIIIVRPWVKSFASLLGGGVIIALFASLLAVGFARHMVSFYQIGLSTGGLLVLVLFCFYFLFFFVKSLSTKLRIFGK